MRTNVWCFKLFVCHFFACYCRHHTAITFCNLVTHFTWKTVKFSKSVFNANEQKYILYIFLVFTRPFHVGRFSPSSSFLLYGNKHQRRTAIGKKLQSGCCVRCVVHLYDVNKNVSSFYRHGRRQSSLPSSTSWLMAHITPSILRVQNRSE